MSSTTANLLNSTVAHELACNVSKYSNLKTENSIQIKCEPSDDTQNYEIKTFDSSSIGYDTEDQQLELAVVDPPPLLKENTAQDNEDDLDYYDNNDSDESFSNSNQFDRFVSSSPPPSLKPAFEISNNSSLVDSDNFQFFEFFNRRKSSTLIDGSNLSQISTNIDKNSNQKTVDDLFNEIEIIKNALKTVLENQLSIVQYISSTNGTQADNILMKLKLNNESAFLSPKSRTKVNFNSQKKKTEPEKKIDSLNSSVSKYQNHINRKVRLTRTSFIPAKVTNFITSKPTTSNISSSNGLIDRYTSASIISQNSNKASKKTLSLKTNNSMPMLKPSVLKSSFKRSLIGVSSSSKLSTNETNKLSKTKSNVISNASSTATATVAVNSTRLLKFLNGVPTVVKNSAEVLTQRDSSPPFLLAQNNETPKNNNVSKRRKITYDDLPPLQRETI